MKRGMEKLTSLSHKMAEQLYKASGGPAGPTPGAEAGPPPGGEEPPAQKPKDDVVDAEFEEAKD